MIKDTLLFIKRKEIYLPLAGIFFVLALAFFFLLPKIGQISALNKEIARQNKDITRLSQKVSDLQTLSEAELFDSASLLLMALPPDKNFYQILGTIKNLYQKNTVDLISFVFSPGLLTEEVKTGKKTKVALPSLPMKTSFTGTYESLQALVNDIENYLPLMTVEAIKFNNFSSSASGSLKRYSGELAIKSYYLPLPKELGNVDQPLEKVSNQSLALIEKIRVFGRYQAEALSPDSLSLTVGKENPFPF